jgi:hypothetical protein
MLRPIGPRKCNCFYNQKSATFPGKFVGARSSVPFARPRRKLRRRGVLGLWHLASFDAPTIAVLWSLAFAWAAGVRLPGWVPLLLALGTWAVYVGDRLLDARTALRQRSVQQLRARHHFHWRHRRTFLPLCAIAAIAAIAIILLLMPVGLRESNSVLAVAAVAYFSGVHSPHKLPTWLRPLLSKEFLVGFLFAAGCAFPSIARLNVGSNTTATKLPIYGAALFFAFVAWLNCSAIEGWESGSAADISGAGSLLCFAGILFALILVKDHSRVAELVATGSAASLLLSILDRLRSRFSPLTLRAVADLVLLTPLLLAPLALRTP